ncbi:MAG: histidine-type phosphatase [Muribaculaceae bacterium]|nr:histidine-type phosphatase [Muribaculaceae bacterium]
MIRFRLILASACILCCATAQAADPTSTSYTMDQCEGSLMPYPAPATPAVYPDSLIPVFVNHVGRHGARYPSSAANSLALKRALEHADSLGTITALGRSMLALTNEVIALSNNRWGALDSLGMAEQAGIATRMFYNYTEVFSSEGVVKAISSYSPRAMMSMYSFTHQLDRLNNRTTFTTSTGRINSRLMRPFDLDKDYLDFRKYKVSQPAYDEFVAGACPLTAIARVLGQNYPFADDKARRELALAQYYVVAGLQAMGLPSQMSKYFDTAEANALWSCFNMRQYLQRTATTISSVPADIASDLVLDIIQTTDNFISGEDSATKAVLRFGHAETIMPLVSLLRLPGCYYLTNYFDTVASHWRDFDVVPMASNVQFILFKSRRSGRFYVQVLLNEKPVQLRKGDDATIYPWGEVRRYLMNCVPLYAQ